MTTDNSTSTKPITGLHSFIEQCIPGMTSKNGRVILDCNGETRELLQHSAMNSAQAVNSGLLGLGALLLHVGQNCPKEFPVERLADIGELIQTLAECRMSLDQLSVVFGYTHE